MLTEQRKAHLLEILTKTGRVVAKDVARALNLSEDTIRRDLRELAAQGHLTRVHGGALPLSPSVGNMAIRRDLATTEKIQLARAAAKLITAGQTIFVDGGTTNLELIRNLRPDIKLTAITHSPSIAVALEHHNAIETILIGGNLFRHSMVAVGAETIEAINRLRSDIFFLGVTGIHASEGLTTGDRDEAAVKRAIANRSGELIVLATQDKLGAVSRFQITEVNKISTLIISAAAKLDEAMVSSGMNVMRAKPI
jgi:DeoR/GlpR family transcriptional regulator of sugar metabolism